MKVRVLREACCAADDQMGPLDAVYRVDADASFAELIAEIRASRFLQFSSTHQRLSGELGGVTVVEVPAASDATPVFFVSASAPVGRMVRGRTLHFRFRHA
ncbi:MAG: hypothetical protein DI563_17235 [Variovorax paradoxus]|uniref:Uncharacterized protein n=1 Tax=Variovorax paradoxus TaxID=34073 RepID=A0A2W5Q078_VARPD|nr:MAG: hypothetical protein DI563_17235 [Variovorax paradoxus]